MSVVEHFVKGMRPPLLGTGYGFGSGHCTGQRAGGAPPVRALFFSL